MNKSRYRRITSFFGWVILKIIFWDLLFPRIGLRKLSEHSRSRRLTQIARGYHDLAVNMGGVLIKVGQFLSARMDVMPPEITDELSGLQDEVPAEEFKDIRALAEAEFSGKLEDIFAEFEEEPLAAASLGQVHRAKLKAQDVDKDNGFGAEVVVKIQRPNIEEIIAIDLAAFNTVARWVMRYKPIRRRVDVPAIMVEFSRILYEEIDYLAEGRNAVAFAENFEGVEGVRIPAVVWSHTTKCVLTLEDVFAIKITDYDEITQAGVSRSDVAVQVFDAYMRQIFYDGFFHADPHPGNLFVDPNHNENGWQLTFVDFGMVGHITPKDREGLREFAIGLATQDPQRMLNGYQIMGVLLPHADLDLVKKPDAAAFERFWGKSMDELRNISFEEMHEFAKEFRELIFAMPFQVPQDLVFLFRTVAILAGICTGLDPDFNFWEVLAPYAQKLIAEEGGSNWEFWLAELGSFAQTLIALPRKAENVLGILESGRLSIRTPGPERELQRINRTLRRGISALLFFAFLTNGVWLYLNEEFLFAGILFAGAVLSLAGAIFARIRHI